MGDAAARGGLGLDELSVDLLDENGGGTPRAVLRPLGRSRRSGQQQDETGTGHEKQERTPHTPSTTYSLKEIRV
jgi:hypothetical protein